VSESFRDLAAVAPNAPLLALGQTVFWDEPMKALIPLIARDLSTRVSLVAGVHDTDYFAKIPGGIVSSEPFVALPKNDGTTKGFWSAAGEFSAMFGGEVPVSRDVLARAGFALDLWSGGDSALVDEATEAWGWRGLAFSHAKPCVTAELPLEASFTSIQKTF
jgi:hypothetical protein